MKKVDELKEKMQARAEERKALKAARKEAFKSLPLETQEEIKAVRTAKIACCVVAGAAVATATLAAVNTARQIRAENIDAGCDTSSYAGIANLY